MGKEKLLNKPLKNLNRSQSFSSFGPPGINDAFAARGGHSFQESVFSGSFPVAWLISAFHKIVVPCPVLLLYYQYRFINCHKHGILIHIFINVNLLFLKVLAQGTQICGIPQYGNGVPGKWKQVLKISIPEKPADGFHCRGKAGQFPDVLLL